MQARSAVRNTEWAEEKIKTVPHMFYDSAEVYNQGIWQDAAVRNRILL